MGFGERHNWPKELETEYRGKVGTNTDKTTNPFAVINSMTDIPILY